MNDSRSSSGGGIGIIGATFIVFLVLKLTGHIDWSWWWVTAPLWISAIVIFIIVAIALAVIGVCELMVRRRRRSRRDLYAELCAKKDSD